MCACTQTNPHTCMLTQTTYTLQRSYLHVTHLEIILLFYFIEECSTDKCTRSPCQHGGKCVTTANSSLCLCSLGYTGDLCETILDLQVNIKNIIIIIESRLIFEIF